MDWARSDHKPPHRPDPPAPELLEECWRLVGPSGRPIFCGIYVDGGPGVEIRVGYSINDVLRTQRASDPAVARHVAEQWRLAALSKGFAVIAPS